ncbi:MAG TPA: thiamine pyrophosphate-binding protein [Candidatus Nitrosotalea sp.]|nr:thiamine pyrophosphate-binding protein [Candidatus Nitrosotalea sp.]
MTGVPRTGADLVVEALAAAGVRQLFSLSGNQILSLYDATHGRGLSILHTRHEAAAVHMADAWGRLTDEPGVALVTAGPGHCNAISALYSALMSESPVVLLSGHAPAAQIGRGAFQEMEQAAVAAPVTKASWLAKDAARLGEDIATALDLARGGRPGPVHVSLPGDLLEARLGDGAAAPARGARRDGPVAAPAESVEQTLALLASARRPLILLGPAMARGARRAAVARLGEATGVPVLAMESPRGFNDPWLHLASPLLGQADLLVLLGKRPDFVVRYAQPPAFAADCRVIQVDADAASLRAGALGIVADPGVVADQLATAARGRAWGHRAWGEEVLRARATVPAEWAAARESARAPIHPLRVAAALQRHVDRGAILVADGGEFGQWIQGGVEAAPRLFNGPAGGIGGAIPMAIAARLRHPDRPVIAALGDGTFGFHAFELDTSARYRLPVVAVIGNDARWNAEHQLQIQHYGADRTVGCELLPSRYEQIAVALGGHGERVERADDLEPALDRALRSGLPAVVNVMIEGLPAPTYGSSTSH